MAGGHTCSRCPERGHGRGTGHSRVRWLAVAQEVVHATVRLPCKLACTRGSLNTDGAELQCNRAFTATVNAAPSGLCVPVGFPGSHQGFLEFERVSADTTIPQDLTTQQEVYSTYLGKPPRELDARGAMSSSWPCRRAPPARPPRGLPFCAHVGAYAAFHTITIFIRCRIIQTRTIVGGRDGWSSSGWQLLKRRASSCRLPAFVTSVTPLEH